MDDGRAWMYGLARTKVEVCLYPVYTIMASSAKTPVLNFDASNGIIYIALP